MEDTKTLFEEQVDVVLNDAIDALTYMQNKDETSLIYATRKLINLISALKVLKSIIKHHRE